MPIAPDQFHDIWEILREQQGIDFSGYQPNMLERRVVQRLATCRVDDLSSYADLCRQDAAEGRALADSIAINYSCFFRNPIVFEIIAHQVLPEIIRRKEPEGRREIRVWSAGCASGEEPVSLRSADPI